MVLQQLITMQHTLQERWLLPVLTLMLKVWVTVAHLKHGNGRMMRPKWLMLPPTVFKYLITPMVLQEDGITTMVTGHGMDQPVLTQMKITNLDFMIQVLVNGTTLRTTLLIT